MSIRFHCECGKKLKATDDKIGKRVLCPDCGQPVTVPTKGRGKAEAIDVTADGEQPLQDSAQTARELLKLSAAAAREEEEAAAPTDARVRKRGEEATLTLTEYVRHHGKQVVLPIVGVVAAFVVVMTTAFWMYGYKPVYPELYPVSGTITLDGEPLVGAEVMFRKKLTVETMMVEEEIKAGASVGRTDEEGKFKLEYAPNVYGAVEGLQSVEISKIIPNVPEGREDAGRESLPPKFNSLTELEIEVKTDQPDGYDFKLQSN